MSTIAPELFIASKGLSSRPIVVHVSHNPKILIASKTLSSWPRVSYIKRSLKMCIAYKASDLCFFLLPLFLQVTQTLRNFQEFPFPLPPAKFFLVPLLQCLFFFSPTPLSFLPNISFFKNLSNFLFSASAPPYIPHPDLEIFLFSLGTPQHIQFFVS